jgi:carboxylesterase
MSDSPRSAATAAAEPFWIDGGSTGILLIHGFMGVPGELHPLGAALAQRGYTISGMLLARHGQLPEALYNVRWQEWQASAEAALRELETRCQRVLIVGYSLGGLIALRLAAQHRLAGVVTLAAALELAGGWPLRTLPVARYVMPWFNPMRRANFNDPLLRASLVEKMGEINWDDPAVIEQLRTMIRIPTGAIHEVVRLGQRVRRDLPQLTQPTLILQGRLDTTVQPRSAEQIYTRLGAADKELAWFERSGHLLPNDIERQAVQQTIAGWIERHLAQSDPAGARTDASRR